MTIFLPAMQPAPAGPWEVEVVTLEHGERLPIIRNRRTWLPAPLALRYVLAMRPRLRPDSLVNDARGVCALYNWAAQDPKVGFLDDWLVRGEMPKFADLKRVNKFLRHGTVDGMDPVAADLSMERDAVGDAPVVDREGEVPATTYHRRLTSVLHFFNWVYEADNAGSPLLVDDDEYVRFVWKLQQRVQRWAAERPVPESTTPDPLTALDIHFVRRALGADAFGRWHYADLFQPQTRLRNWAMFEVAINYGLRRAELLLLRLADLPEDHDPLCNIRVVRAKQQKVDKGLSRKTPRIVTIPALEPDHYDVVRQYLAGGVPESRRVGPSDPEARVFLRSETEVKRQGARRAKPLSPFEPISGTRYAQMVARIGVLAWMVAEREINVGKGTVNLPAGPVLVTNRMLEGIKERLTGLHPHVLRHTWATNFALANYVPHGFEGVIRLLQLYGGWTDDKMPEHYAQHAMDALGQRAAADRLAGFSTVR